MIPISSESTKQNRSRASSLSRRVFNLPALSVTLLFLSALFISVVFSSCRLIDPEDRTYFVIHPGEDYCTLSEGEEVSITFFEDVDRLTVDPLISLTDITGAVGFELIWEEGMRVVIRPHELLETGAEHRLDFKGVYSTQEGKEREASISRPFYSITSSFSPLQFTGITPEGREIFNCHEDIRLSFSSPLDDTTVKAGVKLSPSADYDLSLEENILILSCPGGWDNLTTYRIGLNSDLKSRSGSRLFPETEVSFSVSDDPSNPAVLRTGRCLSDRASGFPWTAAELEGIGADEGIRISFSTPMDRPCTEEALSFSPGLPGTVYWQDEDLVFIPAEPFRSSQNFTLTIRKSASGSSGIPMSDDYRIDFSPEIEALKLQSLDCSSFGGFSLGEFSSEAAYPLPSPGFSPCELCFHLTFSCPFPSDAEKQMVQDMISFYELFSSGGGITTDLISWTGDSRLTIIYSGFTFNDGRDHYYLLEIPGGSGGVSTAQGNHMEEDVRQLFRAVAE